MEYSAPVIPIGLVETVLCSRNAVDLIPGSETHIPALRLVGEVVRYTDDPNWITDIVAGLLPSDYSSNTLDEIPGMVADSIKKGFDRPENQRKSTNTAKDQALAVLAQTEMELFHTSENIGFVAMTRPERGTVCHPVLSEAMKSFLQLQYHEATGKTLSRDALGELVSLLNAKAIYRSREQLVHIRLGGADGDVYYDLGHFNGAVVKITAADGWSVVSHAPIRFYQPNGFTPQVMPIRGGDLNALRKLLNLNEKDWIMLLAFLIACLKPTHPYPILLLSGGHGTGKSKFSEIIKRIIDPNAIDKLRPPKDEHTLVIQASKRWLLVFDNTSSVQRDISDALCAMVTGGGFSTRQYYTDSEEKTFKNARPVVLNGIGEFANRHDLLDRTMVIKLPPMSAEKRRTEKAIDAELDAILPGVLGCLFDIVGVALQNQSTVKVPARVRMADTLEWLAAAEPATGLPEGSFLRVLENSVREATIESTINDPLVVALFQMLDRQSRRKFEGTMGQLLNAMRAEHGRLDRYLPQTPQHLSNMLQRNMQGMADIGLMVEIGERTNRARPVRIWEEPNKYTPKRPEMKDSLF